MRNSTPSKARNFWRWLLPILFTLVLLGPLLAPYDPQDISFVPLSAPSLSHWLGVNDGGIDILSELLYGLRNTAGFGLLAGAAALFLGALVGLCAAWFGGLFELISMRLAEALLAIPTIMLLILAAVFARPTPATLAILLALLIWPTTAKGVRAQTLLNRNRLHIQATQQMGASSSYIIFRHLLPEIYPLLLIGLIGKVRMAIFMEASLAFLGLFDSNYLSLGLIIKYAINFYYLDIWWHWLLPPIFCLSLLLLIPTLLGIRLEKHFDPRLQDLPR